MPDKKLLLTVFLSLLFVSGCELFRASRSKDITINDVSGMFHEKPAISSKEEPVTLSSQVHKFDDWFKDNLW